MRTRAQGAVTRPAVVAPALAVAVCLVSGVATAAAAGRIPDPLALQTRHRTAQPALVLAQNPTNPFTLPQVAEPPVSPINPGTTPGTTAAIGGSITGTNPLTGLPCNGAGSLAVSNAGGLPGTTTAPPGVSETIQQLPIGAPPTTSIYGSQLNLGSC